MVVVFEKSWELGAQIRSKIHRKLSELGSIKPFWATSSGKRLGKQGERHGIGFEA